MKDLKLYKIKKDKKEKLLKYETTRNEKRCRYLCKFYVNVCMYFSLNLLVIWKGENEGEVNVGAFIDQMKGVLISNLAGKFFYPPPHLL